MSLVIAAERLTMHIYTVVEVMIVCVEIRGQFPFLKTFQAQSFACEGRARLTVLSST